MSNLLDELIPTNEGLFSKGLNTLSDTETVPYDQLAGVPMVLSTYNQGKYNGVSVKPFSTNLLGFVYPSPLLKEYGVKDLYDEKRTRYAMEGGIIPIYGIKNPAKYKYMTHDNKRSSGLIAGNLFGKTALGDIYVVVPGARRSVAIITVYEKQTIRVGNDDLPYGAWAIEIFNSDAEDKYGRSNMSYSIYSLDIPSLKKLFSEGPDPLFHSDDVLPHWEAILKAGEKNKLYKKYPLYGERSKPTTYTEEGFFDKKDDGRSPLEKAIAKGKISASDVTSGDTLPTPQFTGYPYIAFSNKFDVPLMFTSTFMWHLMTDTWFPMMPTHTDVVDVGLQWRAFSVVDNPGGYQYLYANSANGFITGEAGETIGTVSGAIATAKTGNLQIAYIALYPECIPIDIFGKQLDPGDIYQFEFKLDREGIPESFNVKTIAAFQKKSGDGIVKGSKPKDSDRIIDGLTAKKSYFNDIVKSIKKLGRVRRDDNLVIDVEKLTQESLETSSTNHVAVGKNNMESAVILANIIDAGFRVIVDDAPDGIELINNDDSEHTIEKHDVRSLISASLLSKVK